MFSSDHGPSRTRPRIAPGVLDSPLDDLAIASQELLPKMQTALLRGRSDQLTRLANLLKGAARRADCQAIYNLAALLESMGVNDSLGTAQVTLAMLKTELHHALHQGTLNDRGTPTQNGDQHDNVDSTKVRRKSGNTHSSS